MDDVDPMELRRLPIDIRSKHDPEMNNARLRDAIVILTIRLQMRYRAVDPDLVAATVQRNPSRLEGCRMLDYVFVPRRSPLARRPRRVYGAKRKTVPRGIA
jgi:hypothetical protein